jgi:hypothetical protein
LPLAQCLLGNFFTCNPGGAPSDREALYFNAHRAFSPETVKAMLKGPTLMKTLAVLDDSSFASPCDHELLRELCTRHIRIREDGVMDPTPITP